MAYIMYDNSYPGVIKPILRKSSRSFITGNEDHVVVNLYEMNIDFSNGSKQVTGWDTSQQTLVKTLHFIKEKAVLEIRDMGFEVLRLTDYQVIRHREQIERSISTTLTTAEYNTIMTRREAGRNWLSTKAQQVRDATTFAQIKNRLNQVRAKIEEEKENIGEVI